MGVDKEFVSYVIDQLSAFGPVETKSMFGGIGLFHNGLMIGKIGGNTFRLKVDEINKREYEERGMKPFYQASKKKGMPYWEVPADVLENREILVDWARKSYEAALRGTKK